MTSQEMEELLRFSERCKLPMKLHPFHYPGGFSAPFQCIGNREYAVGSFTGMCGWNHDRNNPYAEYAVAAMNAVPKLIEEIKKLGEERDVP